MAGPDPSQAPMPDHQSASLMGQESPQPTPSPEADGGGTVANVTIRPDEAGGFQVTCTRSAGTPGAPDTSQDSAYRSVEDLLTYLQGELAS